MNVMAPKDATRDWGEARTSTGLRARAHDLIPGGCHTYAKGDDQFPSNAPAFIARGKGCRVWSVDGREFIEYGMGLRAVTLGHAYGPVLDAVRDHLEHGSNFSRPAPIEVDCAEMLLGFLPGADMAKFAKDGSSVTTAAFKLARAHTGRDMIGLCADHPFFSYNDWFIGTTAMDGGIPPAEKSVAATFRYNDLDSVADMFDRHPGRIACVILEPARIEEPAPGFLEGVQSLCRRQGALLVFDEMITGFRWHTGGAQAVYGVTPDLSTFGKAMANGFSVSALVGKREIMELGGLRSDRPRVFLLSTTHGAETHSLAAAVATMGIYASEDVIGHIARMGERLRAGVTEAARRRGVEGHVGVIGRACNLLYFTRDRDGKPSQPMRTLFMQELVRRGVLGPSFVLSYAHGPQEIDRTVEAVDAAMEIYARGLEQGPGGLLEGPPVKPVYRRFN